MIAVVLIYAVFAAVFSAGAVVSAYVSRRRVEQAALLWTLLQAVERRYPLAGEVAALAEGERPARQARLMRLAEQLERGAPLHEALAWTPRLIPADALLALRVGAQSGLVVPALRQAAQRRLAGTLGQTFFEAAAMWVCYLLALLILISAIVTFVMVSIIPKFKKIFEDFGVELPAMTKAVIEVSDVAVTIAPLAAVFVVAGIAALAWLLIHLAHGGSVPVPFVRGIRLATPGALRICAMHVGASRPLHAALTGLAREHPSPRVSGRLRSVATETEAGGDAWQALAVAGFLRRPEQNVLSSAAAAGNLPWALSELADAIERRWADRLRLVQDLVRPAIVLPFGIVVLSIATAFFLPLVKLLNDLS